MSFDPGGSGISGASDVFLSNPAADDALSYNSGTGKWTNAAVGKTRVGLGNVDNTSDANKPVSSATQTALNLKANLASPTFTGTVSGITKSMVGLANVDNTSDANKPISTATQTALDGKIGTSWNIRPVIYATGLSTWPAGRPVPAGYSGPVTWDSLAYPAHPDPTAMQAGDDWLRRLS